MNCEILDLGLTTYEAAEEAQLKMLAEVKAGSKEAGLIFAEFFPVYTIGKSGEAQDIEGISVIRANRGGDITLHNPGQLVAYPVFNLVFLKKDIHWYLRSLEEVIINTLSEYGISPCRRKGYTGVWAGDKKIASIGVAVSRWVTYHGLAVNVANDLSLFDYINPCGIKDCRMTSMTDFIGSDIDIEGVKLTLARQFSFVFGIKIYAGIEPTAAVA